MAAKIAIRRARLERVDPVGPGGQGDVGADDPQPSHPGEPLVADRVPALLIDRGVAVDLVLGGVQREVGGVEGEVEEPGSVRLPAVLGEEVERVIGEGVGGVELVLRV
jgi:hypothetical protein